MSATGVEGQPFRVGKVIGRSFSVLVQNIGPVGLLAVALLSVPYVLGHVLGFRYSGGLFIEFQTAACSWRVGLAESLQYFLTVCLEAVIAVGVYETLQGHRPGARALVRGGLLRFPALLAVVVAVTVPGVLAGLAVSVVITVPGLSMPAILLLNVAWIVLSVASTFLLVAIPAAAVEGLGPMRSIARSVHLVRSSFFRVIGLLLALLFVIFVPVFAATLLLELTGIERSPAHYRTLVWPDLLFTSFYAALSAVMCIVAYRDLRAYREGPDLTRVAAGFD